MARHNGCRSRIKWKSHCVTQTIGKMHLGSGKGDILRGYLKHTLPKQYGGINQRLMTMHYTFGCSRGARGVEPKRDILGVGGPRRKFI